MRSLFLISVLSTVFMFVRGQQLPTVDAGTDLVGCPNDGFEKRFNPTVTGNIKSCKWTPSTGLQNDNILNPLVNVVGNITYTLTVTTVDGYKAQDKVNVRLATSIGEPTNLVTPNGDGVNDVWKILGWCAWPDMKVEVRDGYNGTLYYTSEKGYENPWDGKNTNGRTYCVWTIWPNKPGVSKMQGYITLIFDE